MDDHQIIELYWLRLEAAITETAKKYSAYCRTIAYGILRNAEDTEECLNDTWLRAWNAIPPGRPVCLAAFLGKITRNLSFDTFKKYHAKKRNAGEMPLVLEELEHCIPFSDPVSQAADYQLLIECLEQFLHALPKERRQLFLLRYWYVMSIKDIGRQLHLTESQITTSLFRLRKELKLYLEKEGIVL